MPVETTNHRRSAASAGWLCANAWLRRCYFPIAASTNGTKNSPSRLRVRPLSPLTVRFRVEPQAEPQPSNAPCTTLLQVEANSTAAATDVENAAANEAHRPTLERVVPSSEGGDEIVGVEGHAKAVIAFDDLHCTLARKHVGTHGAIHIVLPLHWQIVGCCLRRCAPVARLPKRIRTPGFNTGTVGSPGVHSSAARAGDRRSKSAQTPASLACRLAR